MKVPIHVDRRHPDELGEAAGVEVGGVQGFADGVVAGQAVAAGVAGHVVRDEDAVAGLEALDAVPDLVRSSRRSHGPGRSGRLLEPIPLQHVAAADAAGHDLDQDLARPDRSARHLLEPDVVCCCSTSRSAHDRCLPSPPFPASSKMSTGLPRAWPSCG